MEKTFADELAKTNDATYAAWKAGSSNPVVIGQRMAAKPPIQEASREAARRFLREEGAMIGVTVLAKIAQDEKAPAGARVSAANNLVKHSGISADEATAKDLSEMTGEELAREIARATARQAVLQHVAAERARPVIEAEANEVEEAEEGVFS